jgi:dienelactone hydrolase
MTLVRRLQHGLWILALGLLGAQASHAAVPPVEAFGTTPIIENVTLSLDGRFIASSYAGDKVAIVILDRNTKKLTQRIDFDQTLKLRGMSFVSDHVLIAQFSITYTQRGDAEQKAEIGAVFAIDARDGSSRQLLEAKTNSRIYPSSGGFLSRKGAAPDEILMTALILENAAAGASPDAAFNSVLSVNPLTGKWRIIERGSRTTNGWLVDVEGKIVGRTEFNRKEQRRTVRVKDGNDYRIIYEYTDPDFYTIGLAGDGQSVLALGARGGDRVRLWSIPFNGSGPQPLFQDPDYDVEGVVRDIYDRRLLGVSIGGLEQRVYWLDTAAENRVKALESSLPGRRIQIAGYTRDGNLVLAFAGSRNHPGAYYLVDYRSNRAEIVGQEYPQLARVALGEVTNVTYPARDGYPVPAYLTLPANKPAKDLPLVVLPHGGPRARDSGVGFDWWSQFVASRGYAVLQPQFRGSTGFGQKHELAGYRQWGQLMQHDVTDGVKYLIDKGIVDADRVCIVGASYGGYSALAGATFTPDLYRCAVSVAGVSDLVEMLRWVENRGGIEDPAVRFWRRHIGKTGDPDVAAFSPARAADKVTATVLMMHGVDDTVVPYVQTEYMETAMRRAKTPHEVFKLKSEDHWLSRSPSRIEMLTQLDRFLDQHIGSAYKVSVDDSVAQR